MEALYQVTWRTRGKFFCFGVVVDQDDVVLQAAPIARWATNKGWTNTVRPWFEDKGAKVKQVTEYED